MKKFAVAVIFIMATIAFVKPGQAADISADSKPKTFPDFIFSASEEEKKAMDIHPSDYADFWKKWHFVTVRWRQDIREFRYTFANDLAWKTLSEHKTDYPVGAMFGKLIYPAEEDLALPSSVLPSNQLNRLEVILWDPTNKKASSDGWVYLRFINPVAPQEKDSTGILGVMSDKEIKSCVECHARVADRGFVFSQPAYLFHDAREDSDVNKAKVATNRFAELMQDMDASNVPRIAMDLVRSIPEWKDRKIKGHEGDYFIGAFGELRPVLAKLAQEDTKSVYMLFDRDDPNTIELASSVERKGYDHCSGIVRLLGLTPAMDTGSADSMRAEEAKGTKTSTRGMPHDLTKEFRPIAMFHIICNGDPVSKQELPLLYKVKDSDGLPSYFFAPAKIN